MKMSITCTIEARLNSSRLPGKSFYSLCGKPVIQYAVTAALESGVVDRVILCTTMRPADDLLAHFSRELGIECFRGSEEDVAGRIASAVSEGSDTNIFLTGDNPFVTSDLVADSFRQFIQTGADYLCTNHMKYCKWWKADPALPTGLSVQIAKTRFFLEAERAISAKDLIREHSTMVMYKEKLRNREYRSYIAADGISDLWDVKERYTIDTADDYVRATKIASQLKNRSLKEVLIAGRISNELR